MRIRRVVLNIRSAFWVFVSFCCGGSGVGLGGL